MLKIRRISFPFLEENRQLITRSFITILFIGLGIWFLKHERTELSHVKNVLAGANVKWIVTGLVLVFTYIFLQGLMYLTSFFSVNVHLKIRDVVILFLKRNFISIFLPAGGVSSLAFYTKDLEEKGFSKTQIYFASSIYGFTGILSVVVVAVPAFIYFFTMGSINSSEIVSLSFVILLVAAMYAGYQSIIRQGTLYKIILKLLPKSQVFFAELQSHQTDKKYLFLTLLVSVLIEFVGIAHVYIAMLALSYSPSLLIAIVAYLVVVLFLIISPFLRGLGAIEVSMSYVLTRFGFTNVEAISIMILFRFFEFWLPLIAGIISFTLKVNKLLMRVLPSFLLLTLGVVNIISVATPAIKERMVILRDFLNFGIIYSSNILVIITGLFLLVTAVFMLKGLRTTWWFAVFLSAVSFIGHLTKGIDYEEASIALIVLLILIGTRKEYYIKTNPRIRNIGIQTSFYSVFAVLLYGIIGFFFIDKRHFHIDFNLRESVYYTFRNFFLIGSDDLVFRDNFSRDFIYSIRISGFLSVSFLIYSLIRPYVIGNKPSEEETKKAKEFTEKFGNSPLDYFKSYFDKIIFWNKAGDAFISYRISGNFAVVLENPVAENRQAMQNCIIEFRKYCYENGLKDIYYRVPADCTGIYKQLNKKSLFLGQEGVVDLKAFTLEGREAKSIRNAVRKVADHGYITKIHQPPLMDGTLQKLKAVSDEWLKTTERQEILFSQGIFLEKEIKNHTVITVENPEEKIIAFLNIIPDYVKNEGTYDLIRKTVDAPNGIMDFILIELFNYFRSRDIQYVNIGFAPMSGLNDPHNFTESSMKFAYEKIRSFSQYKGQREYKEKFMPLWYDRYLVYTHDYDLIQVPVVLSNVIKM